MTTYEKLEIVIAKLKKFGFNSYIENYLVINEWFLDNELDFFYKSDYDQIYRYLSDQNPLSASRVH